MLYRIEDLIKSYGAREVLNLKNLSLEGGRIHGLIGPNGAGKTTFLEILAFLLPPTSGEIWYQEERVDFSSVRLSRLRKKVVLVQQHPILFTTSVFNNVVFPMRIRGKTQAERVSAVDELLGLVGMEAFRKAGAHRLSGGETQRVAIAQALACSPEVVLLDEPTASVDMENQIIIERIIRDINRDKGISVVFTTHDIIQASRLAHEIVYLFDGRIAESIHENIFSGHIVSGPDGQKYCKLQNNLRFPVITERSGHVRIAINPHAIDIRKDSLNGAGEDNLRGRLIQLTQELDHVRALINVGVPLSVLIPKERARDQELYVGEEVRLDFPPESIELF